MGIIDKCADELRTLADEAKRLPPPNRRNPHAFHEARDELAVRMLNLANVMTGNITIGVPKAFVQNGPVRTKSGNVIPFEIRNKKRV